MQKKKRKLDYRSQSPKLRLFYIIHLQSSLQITKITLVSQGKINRKSVQQSLTQIAGPQTEFTHECCYKLLSLGAICSMAIHNR